MLYSFKAAGLWRFLSFRRVHRFWINLYGVISVSVVLFFLIDPWGNKVWNERAKAASNLLRGPTIWQRLTKPEDIFTCYSTAKCTAFPFQNISTDQEQSSETCPFYFKWIKQDLKPWEKSGITLKAMESARRIAHFRVMIVGGRLFVESYKKSFQTRDLFTIWGFAQLLKFYPGMVPDVDLMFHTADKPTVMSKDYGHNDIIPPVFRYCGSNDTFAILFPDWSFWGWPEIEIRPWNELINELEEANRHIKWEEREPYAYWRGNPLVAEKRRDLLACSQQPNWKGQVFSQNWLAEKEKGYNDSKLAEQCKHRYKIYVEGKAWSVSLKYIMACDSTTLLIDTPFTDFIIRGLLPGREYCPIRTPYMCQDIDFAVDSGNHNILKAKEIGRLGADYVLKNTSMTNVYSYMLHSLNEYAKLLKYKPKVTKGASEFCQETILCFAREKEMLYMRSSMVTAPNPSPPCELSQNLSADEAIISDFNKEKASALEQLLTHRP